MFGRRGAGLIAGTADRVRDQRKAERVGEHPALAEAAGSFQRQGVVDGPVDRFGVTHPTTDLRVLLTRTPWWLSMQVASVCWPLSVAPRCSDLCGARQPSRPLGRWWSRSM